MNRLINLWPLIAVYGIAIQQVIELLDAATPGGRWKGHKKIVSKLFAAGVGAMLVIFLHPGLLPVEVAIAGLSISASAEIWNSVLKFLVYVKETRKASAALALSTSGTISLEAIARK